MQSDQDEGMGTYKGFSWNWERGKTTDGRFVRCIFTLWRGPLPEDMGQAPLFEVLARVSNLARDITQPGGNVAEIAYAEGLRYLHELIDNESYTPLRAHGLDLRPDALRTQVDRAYQTSLNADDLFRS